MGSSSSVHLGESTRYTHHSCWTEDLDKEVSVYVFGYRIWQALGLGVHHCICCDGIGDGKFRIAEWSPDGLEKYACAKIQGHKHRYLGRYKLGDVLDAINKSSYQYSYSTDYTCNTWTKNVASNLGWTLGCCWNCSCVLDSPDVVWWAD